MCYARADHYPLANGHLLIIPHGHIADFFELTEHEQKSALELLSQARAKLDSKFHPDGYNIGVNVGEPAGQTDMHVHIHLIPRYRGDIPDPKGGVRWIIPAKDRYWPD